MSSRLSGALSVHLGLAIFFGGVGPASAQDQFPAGVEGEIYYCPRIDLNPVKDGGPLAIALDGILDEPAWQRAQFQKWSVRAGEVPVPDFDPPEADIDLSWAAVADDEFLYVAWRIVDESRLIGESTFCDVWGDDSVEVYIDALNDGPACPDAGGNCYRIDDAQLTIGANQIGKTDPELLEFGGLGGKASCDFTGPAPDLCKGVATELDSPELLPGWQGEIAIALDTLGNGGDGSPEWHITPSHGTVIGFSMQVNDDDNGGARDHKLLWSKIETVESAWRNPGVFGKLVFVSPDRNLTVVSRDLPDGLHNGDSGTVTFHISPKFGAGAVKIQETLPGGLVPSAPTDGGTVNGSAVTWDLGPVASERSVSYTVTIAADAIDAGFSGTATIDGEQVTIGGDTAYTGSAITADGFIKMWSHLGPLASGLSGGATCDPGPDLAADWIVNQDGTIDETTIFPFPGMITTPSYGGTGIVADGTGARATGLTMLGGGVATDQFPVWHGAISPADTIDHASAQVHGFNADDQVTLSCVYVTNLGPTAIDTNLGLASDDSIQVYLNDAPVFISNLCGGYGNPGEEHGLAPISLPVGESRILVKVSDGTLTSGFRLRIQDPAGGGLLPPAISLSLESKNHPPPVKVVRVMPDTYRSSDTIIISLTATAPAAADVLIREVLPAGVDAADITDNGQNSGGAIEWHLPAVTARTVSYRMVPGNCAGDLSFAGSTCSVGPIESLIGGRTQIGREVPDDDLGTWASQDIGPAEGAAQRIDDGSVLVSAAGVGFQLLQSDDQFRFISKAASGDFELTARIDCLDAAGVAAQTGLMVRDTLDAFSSHAFFYLSPAKPAGGGVGTLKGLYRYETSTTRTNNTVIISDRNVASLPITLRLKRTGNMIFFQRWDGAQFNDVATKEIGSVKTSQVKLGAETLIGLAVSGGGGGKARASFSGLSGFTSGGGPTFRRGDVDASGAPIDISDVLGILNYLYLGADTPNCLEAADIDDTGVVELTDAINSLGYQFLGGASPAPPGPLACGPDGSPPFLGCTKPCP